MQPILERHDNLIGSFPIQKVGVADFSGNLLPCEKCKYRVQNWADMILGISISDDRSKQLPLCTLGVPEGIQIVHIGGDEKVMRFVDPYMLRSLPDFRYACDSFSAGATRGIVLTWRDKIYAGGVAEGIFNIENGCILRGIDSCFSGFSRVYIQTRQSYTSYHRFSHHHLSIVR